MLIKCSFVALKYLFTHKIQISDYEKLIWRNNLWNYFFNVMSSAKEQREVKNEKQMIRNIIHNPETNAAVKKQLLSLTEQTWTAVSSNYLYKSDSKCLRVVQLFSRVPGWKKKKAFPVRGRAGDFLTTVGILTLGTVTMKSWSHCAAVCVAASLFFFEQEAGSYGYDLLPPLGLKDCRLCGRWLLMFPL